MDNALGAVVLAVQILLLLAGWLLFQQAKTELTARAAEQPALAEVRELRATVTVLIEQIKLEAGQASAQLEARCLEARDLLAALDRKLEEAQRAPAQGRGGARGRRAAAEPSTEPQAAAGPEPRHREVLALAQAGEDAGAIARRTGLPVGEVELILGLRRAAS